MEHFQQPEETTDPQIVTTVPPTGQEAEANLAAQAEVSEVVTREVSRIRRRHRLMTFSGLLPLISIICFQICSLVVYAIAERALFEWMLIGDLVLDFVLLVAALLSIGGQVFSVWANRGSARRLATLDDPRAIAPLLETYEKSLFWKESEVKQTLIRLLRNVKASDADIVGASGRKWLVRKLKGERWSSDSADLNIAILKALEQIGDASDVPVIERLAKSARHPDVRRAALECLPALMERTAPEQNRQTLLRPAIASCDLLRPAHGVAEPDPQTLLRPASPEESER